MSNIQSEAETRLRIGKRLLLFRQTAGEVCNRKAGAAFVECAERIDRSIEMGVASSRGVLLASGQRLAHATPEAAL
jgi:hypothetical protein